MSKVSKADREEFAGYCRTLTTEQVRNVVEKEQSAGRRVYAGIAREELARRGD